MPFGPVREPASPELRLQLKPAVSGTAYVNGGWWPRSRDLTAELPGLLTDLSPALGPIAVLGYHVTAWDTAPHSIKFEQHRVLLQGFTAEDPHSVIVIGASGRRLTLLVVAPDCSDVVAQRLLCDAARADSERSAAPATAGDQSLTNIASRIVELEGVTDPVAKSTISAWVEQAAAQFAAAPVQSFVPILVEHIVRTRIAGDPPSKN